MANFTYPKGTTTRVVKVTLSEEHYRDAQAIGKGYAAHGLREAMRLLEQAENEAIEMEARRDE